MLNEAEKLSNKSMESLKLEKCYSPEETQQDHLTWEIEPDSDDSSSFLVEMDNNGSSPDAFCNIR